MQQLSKSIQKSIGIFLTVLLLVVGILTFSTSPVRADETDTTRKAECGWVVFGTCQTEGQKGVVVDNDGNSPNEKQLTGVNLQGKDLTQANLSGANLNQVKLSGANLSNADLSGATLAGANLKGVNLSGIDWSGIKLTKQDLLNLIKLNMAGGGWFQTAPILSKQDILNLVQPELHQAILTGNNLSEANLSGANLSKANLIGANLQGAKLGGVDLTAADLTGAKMPNGRIYNP